ACYSFFRRGREGHRWHIRRQAPPAPGRAAGRSGVRHVEELAVRAFSAHVFVLRLRRPRMGGGAFSPGRIRRVPRPVFCLWVGVVVAVGLRILWFFVLRSSRVAPLVVSSAMMLRISWLLSRVAVVRSLVLIVLTRPLSLMGSRRPGARAGARSGSRPGPVPRCSRPVIRDVQVRHHVRKLILIDSAVGRGREVLVKILPSATAVVSAGVTRPTSRVSARAVSRTGLALIGGRVRVQLTSAQHYDACVQDAVAGMASKVVVVPEAVG
ncbi:hypothetical protein B0T19DRAFT_455405, partial [Cercophora scortea]